MIDHWKQLEDCPARFPALARTLETGLLLQYEALGRNVQQAGEADAASGSTAPEVRTVPASGSSALIEATRRVAVATTPLLLAVVLLQGCKSSGRPTYKEEVRVIAAAIDTSASARPTDRCAEVGARVETAVHVDETAVMDVLVLATGDEVEPAVVVPWTRVGGSDRLFGDSEAEAREQRALVERLVKRCRARLRPSSRSPIYQMLRRSVEAVLAHCREIERDGHKCVGPLLALHSDLQENVDKRLLEMLRAPHAPVAATPAPRLGVAGLDVRVCGYSEHDGRSLGQDVVAVWRQVLGDQATFNPTCPISEEPASVDAEH